MERAIDRRKSLQELEHDDWGEPGHESYLVTTVHRLRRKPLAEFTVEDFRIMIGQETSLPILIPLAVERLEQEPLAEGDFFPGDLLQSVLHVGEAFWSSHPDSLQRVRKIVARVKETLAILEEADRQTILDILSRSAQSLAEEPVHMLRAH